MTTARITRLRPKLDNLIDWYKEFKPETTEIHTDMTDSECREFAVEIDGQLKYRNFVMIPK